MTSDYTSISDSAFSQGAVEERPVGREALLAAALLAIERGEASEARRLANEARLVEPSAAMADEWARIDDASQWPDEWLIAGVRRDPPDVEMLDALVDRYWKPLFARCRVLTLDAEKANDLAQEVWRRVLRVRHSLRPDGNFPGYLMTAATNLWKDAQRAARRAGPMAERRLVSLDAPLAGTDGETVILADVLPDLNALDAEEKARLRLDIDQALEQLSPLLREVLVARFIVGESCAEIGRRYSRTEQTVSGWVREAIRQMKLQFERPDRAIAGNDER